MLKLRSDRTVTWLTSVFSIRRSTVVYELFRVFGASRKLICFLMRTDFLGIFLYVETRLVVTGLNLDVTGHHRQMQTVIFRDD
ncbi:hypothetical protein RRG08_058841 [Elysia crispata]|uniref:Uncharacterized protein n=1 Tax=Elysia crispata TaxID=231223 RepID=A0AAE0Y0E5_9GAST|nr:hypothetical protein RRG08_058841 [Elysia crispata]